MRTAWFTVSAISAFQLLMFCAPAAAVTFGYTESFTLNDAGWRGIQATQLLDHHLTGGVNNGGFVDIAPANAVPPSGFNNSNGAVVFRAASTASGGAFAGNWIDAGVTQVRAYLRHNFDQFPIEFYVRLTSGPAAVFFGDQTVAASDEWQLVNFEISPANYTFAGGSFNSVVSNVQNFQIGARVMGTIDNPGDATLLFDLDQVTLVPEPATIIMALGSALSALPWRRRTR